MYQSPELVVSILASCYTKILVHCSNCIANLLQTYPNPQKKIYPPPPNPTSSRGHPPHQDCQPGWRLLFFKIHTEILTSTLTHRLAGHSRSRTGGHRPSGLNVYQMQSQRYTSNTNINSHVKDTIHNNTKRHSPHTLSSRYVFAQAFPAQPSNPSTLELTLPHQDNNKYGGQRWTVQSIDSLFYLTITGQSLLLDAPTLYSVHSRDSRMFYACLKLVTRCWWVQQLYYITS